MARHKYAKPLNRALYDFLWERFSGNVLVAKRGQKFRYSVTQVNGTPIIDKLDGGEEYQVNCPLCGDKRRRLYVNHRWGTLVHGAEVRHLAHCFNENCSVNSWLREHMDDLATSYSVEGSDDAQAVDAFDMDAIAAEAAERHDRLTAVLPVDSLAPDHPAALYLESRGFNRTWLYDRFRVGYHEGSGRHPRNRRIIAPVFYGGMMVGWNARAIPGHTRLTPADPAKKWPWREGKYVNSAGMPKSKFLYNLDLASAYSVIVVVEGVSDCWRAGEWSVAIMGKQMSREQCRQLCRAAEARKAWIVMLGDASTELDDAASAWRANRAVVMNQYQYSDRVRLHLFDKGDPGDSTTEELQKLVMGLKHGEVPDVA